MGVNRVTEANRTAEEEASHIQARRASGDGHSNTLGVD